MHKHDEKSKALLTNTYFPKWQALDNPEHEEVSNRVCVQVFDQGNVIFGYSWRPYAECYPSMASREEWEKSELYALMIEEATQDRLSRIKALV